MNRGRVTSVATPAFGTDTSPRTVTTNDAVNDDARTTTVTDPAGTVTNTVDLLGRTVAYTDATGIVTTTSYDQAGRVTSTTSQGSPGGGGTSTLAYTYRADGQLDSVSVDGALMATVGYDGKGELASVSYPFGTLDTLVKTPAGALMGNTWTVGVRTFTEALTRSTIGAATRTGNWCTPSRATRARDRRPVGIQSATGHDRGAAAGTPRRRRPGIPAVTQPQLPLRLTDVPLIDADPLTEAKRLANAAHPRRRSTRSSTRSSSCAQVVADGRVPASGLGAASPTAKLSSRTRSTRRTWWTNQPLSPEPANGSLLHK